MLKNIQLKIIVIFLHKKSNTHSWVLSTGPSYSFSRWLTNHFPSERYGQQWCHHSHVRWGLWEWFFHLWKRCTGRWPLTFFQIRVSHFVLLTFEDGLTLDQAFGHHRYACTTDLATLSVAWILNAVMGNFKGSIGSICHCYGWCLPQIL